MKKNILIIGGGSGIGGKLSDIFKKTHNVIATYRESKPKLNSKNVYKLDMSRLKEVRKFVKWLALREIKIDYILLIAAQTGTNIRSSNIKDKTVFSKGLSAKQFQSYLKINCINPVILFELLLQKQILKKECRAIFFSSLAGSISLRGEMSHNKVGGNMIYRISKSALNSAVKSISYDLSKTKMIIVALHPGWVRTKSGGLSADLSVVYSTKKIYELIFKLNRKHNGKFLNYDGKELKW
jgi:NAD(P)-dependent dehydrogenase (short-subunit alcohol dehydrogenase family)